MKRFLFLPLFIFLITDLWAAKLEVLNVPKLIKRNKCSSEINELITEWGASSDKWQGLLGDDGKFLYVKPTGMLAVWIEFQNIEGVNQFSKITPGNITKVRFDQKCVKSLSVINSTKEEVPANVIDDEKLFVFIQKNINGAIYNWSPHMGLSLQGLKTIKELSDEMKFPLLVLLDPSSEINFAKQRLKEEHIAIEEPLVNSSMDLYYRRANLHFPNLIVFKNGRIVKGFLPGLSSKSQYKNYIKARI